MNVQEIEMLIEACKNAGVTKFKFDKLVIHFSPEPAKRVATATASPSLADRAIELDSDEDEYLRELAMQNLLIESPLEYEAAMRAKANGAYGSRTE